MSNTINYAEQYTNQLRELYGQESKACLLYTSYILHESEYDVHIFCVALDLIIYRRPLYAGVAWNYLTVFRFYLRCSRPLCEGVDWNFLPCPMRLSPQFYSKARLEVDDILFHTP